MKTLKQVLLFIYINRDILIGLLIILLMCIAVTGLAVKIIQMIP